MDIIKNISRFMKGRNGDLGRKPDGRYSSFDYCFNYFRSGHDKDILSTEMEQSCLQLGFYLASWGMYRGSTLLLKRSSRVFIPIVEQIEKLDRKVWSVDVPAYDQDNIDLILESARSLKASFVKQGEMTDTLVTKIMLGVFGNVPAFDTYFRKGSGHYSFSKEALEWIKDFYEKDENKECLDKKTIRTINFRTGVETRLLYSKAKLIDMVFFIEGLKNA